MNIQDSAIRLRHASAMRSKGSPESWQAHTQKTQIIESLIKIEPIQTHEHR